MKQSVPIRANGLNLKHFPRCKPPVVVKDGQSDVLNHVVAPSK